MYKVNSAVIRTYIPMPRTTSHPQNPCVLHTTV